MRWCRWKSLCDCNDWASSYAISPPYEWPKNTVGGCPSPVRLREIMLLWSFSVESFRMRKQDYSEIPTIVRTSVTKGSLLLPIRPGSIMLRTSIPNDDKSRAHGLKASPFPPAQWKQISRALKSFTPHWGNDWIHLAAIFCSISNLDMNFK